MPGSLRFLTLVVLFLGFAMMPGRASSHREAPLISGDPQADTTDVYAFLSPDAPDMVTLIASYIPFEDPAGGPNFFRFGDSVLYEIKIDNNGDAVEDITYQFRFTSQVVNPNTFLYGTGQIKSLDDPNRNMLRLNTDIAPVASPARLGVLAADIAGFPNGRRLTDDVVDITLQAAAGVLTGARVNTLGDGVDRNDVPFRSGFPYLALPHSGGNPWKLNPRRVTCGHTIR